ncbi:MAG: nucleoside hydrolase [Planctomycetota bacterium]
MDYLRQTGPSLAVVAAFLMLPWHTALNAKEPEPERPVGIIFDTDMGNDIDDALALGVLHALVGRGECQLLAVTSTKDDADSLPFCDLVNTFYGRGDIPLGAVRGGKTPDPSKYTRPIVLAQNEGKDRFPRKLRRNQDAPDAVEVLRQTLAKQPDQSVVIVQVGFSSNLARLLDSPPDSLAPWNGRELVEKKCRLLSMMAGWFADDRKKEYNVYIDAPAARKVFALWPTPIVASGYEIGLAIKYPAQSIENDFRYVPHHPIAEAYPFYMKMPYDREAWDLTSALYAVRSNHGYFELSPTGTITVDDGDVTQFTPAPDGKHRYLIASGDQVIRVREALVQLASQPPCHGEAGKHGR